MKTLTDGQTTEREKTGQDIYWLVEIDFPAPTGTKYYSTRDITIEGRAYEGTLTRYPALSKVLLTGIDQDGIADAAEIGFRSLHEEAVRFEDLTLKHTMEGLVVRLRYIFKDQAASITLADIIDAHIYRIDDWETTTQEVILKLVDFTLALGEREVGRPITPEAFPKAPPESMGRIIPIIWGDCRDCEMIPMDVGQETFLNGSILPDRTIIKVDKIENFSVSKPHDWTKILIGEEIVYYNYINTADNEFGSLSSPCKRGQDDTVAREHSDRTKVQELKTYYDYIVADHRCKLVDNVRVADRPITNIHTSWRRVDDRDVQILRLLELPTYEEVMPISTFLTVSGEKDKDGQAVWLWTTGGSNTATDAGFSYDVEGIFSFAQITKDNPLLHIKMENSLADGASKYGNLVNVRLGIEYYESQPHDEAKPPYVQLKKDGAYQNLHENVHAYVNLKRTAEQETEADNPDHQHEDDFKVTGTTLRTTRLSLKTIWKEISQQIHLIVWANLWHGMNSALGGLSSYASALLFQLGTNRDWQAGGTAFYHMIVQYLKSLWFTATEVPFTNGQAAINKVTVKVVAGYGIKNLFNPRRFTLILRAKGSTDDPAANQSGTPIGKYYYLDANGEAQPSAMGGCFLTPLMTANAYKAGQSYAGEQVLTDEELISRQQTFLIDITDDVLKSWAMPSGPISGWDFFKQFEMGIHTIVDSTQQTADDITQQYEVLCSESYNYRIYSVEINIEYEPLGDELDLSGQVLLADRLLLGEIASNRAIQKINITKCVENNGGWAFFNETPEVFINFNSTDSDIKIYILNVFFEFEYRAKTMRIGTGRVTADVQGIFSGATLYENPAQILWYIYNNADWMGLDASYLDATSFTATQTELTSRNYKFARRIAEPITIKQLIAEAVWQTRSRLYFEGTKYYLDFRKVSAAGLYAPGASVFTMDKDCILNYILPKVRSSTLQLANQISIFYDKSNNDIGFLRSHEIEDAESKERGWGLRRQTVEARWHSHNNSTVIADLAGFLIHLLAWKHTLVTIETPLLCAHLERGDITLINHPESELNYVPGEIVRTRRLGPARLQFMVDTIVASAYAYWYDENNYISISPGRTMMYFVLEGELVATLDWKGNLKLKRTYFDNATADAGDNLDPVLYEPAYHRFVFSRPFDPPTGHNILRLYSKFWDTEIPGGRGLYVNAKTKTNHAITSEATTYITNSADWIRFAVNGTDVVAEYIHAEPVGTGIFYLKGGMQTNVLL